MNICVNSIILIYGVNMFKIGDYVTRKKYNNDIIFKITKIENNKVYLRGTDLRLFADAFFDDLELCTKCKKKEENIKLRKLDINNYFYIPGTILHLDTDEEYLNKCLKYYKDQNIKAYGYKYNIKDFKNNVIDLLQKHEPSVLVITGHDAYYKKTNTYKNSKYFIETVKEVRKYYKKHQDLIIVAGACQSDYRNLILSKSTFASSPKHINVSALDPAIIAASIALLEQNEKTDIVSILKKTTCGSDGFGGVITNGMMFVGFPRKDD